MFVPGVNPDLYISDPSQLEPGMEIWSVGQGGACSVSKPSFLGNVLELHKSVNLVDGTLRDERDFFMFVRPDGSKSGTSFLDHHILPQEYNNWYFCSSEENANVVYDYIAAQWAADPRYEEDRQEFNAYCSRGDYPLDDYIYDDDY